MSTRNRSEEACIEFSSEVLDLSQLALATGLAPASGSYSIGDARGRGTAAHSVLKVFPSRSAGVELRDQIRDLLEGIGLAIERLADASPSNISLALVIAVYSPTVATHLNLSKRDLEQLAESGLALELSFYVTDELLSPMSDSGAPK